MQSNFKTLIIRLHILKEDSYTRSIHGIFFWNTLSPTWSSIHWWYFEWCDWQNRDTKSWLIPNSVNWVAWAISERSSKIVDKDTWKCSSWWGWEDRNRKFNQEKWRWCGWFWFTYWYGYFLWLRTEFVYIFWTKFLQIICFSWWIRSDEKVVWCLDKEWHLESG